MSTRPQETMTMMIAVLDFVFVQMPRSWTMIIRTAISLLPPWPCSCSYKYTYQRQATLVHRSLSPFLLLQTSLASYLLFSSTCCPCVVGACLVGAGSSVASILGLLALSALLGGDDFDMYCDRSSSAYRAFMARRSCCILCFSSRSALTFFFAK